MAVVAARDAACVLEFRRPAPDTLVVCLSGDWTIHASVPSADKVRRQLDAGGPVRRVVFDAQQLAEWDSALLTFLLQVVGETDRRGIAANRGGLPEGVRRLLALATAVPERRDTGAPAAKPSWLARIGVATLEGVRDATATLAFLGEVSTASARAVVGRARYRRSDFLLILQEVGAQVYVADLVGIGMPREMGAMMAAVIMAGRTGAAFAAQLGTMQVNEEIDAPTTL